MNFGRKLARALTVVTTCATVATPVSAMAAPIAPPAPAIPIVNPTLQNMDFELIFETMFNAEEYAVMYPEVVKAVGNNKKALFKHYLSYGLFEGRCPSFKVSPQAAMVMAGQFRTVLGTQGIGGDTIARLKEAANNPMLQAMLVYATVTAQSVATTGVLPQQIAAATGGITTPTVTNVQPLVPSSEPTEEVKESENSTQPVAPKPKLENCRLVYVTDADENTKVYKLEVDFANLTCEQLANLHLVYTDATGSIEGVVFDAEAGVFLIEKSAIGSNGISLSGTISLVDDKGNIVAKGTARGQAVSDDVSVHEVCKGLYNDLVAKIGVKTVKQRAYDEAFADVEAKTTAKDNAGDALDEARQAIKELEDEIEELEGKIESLKADLEKLIAASEDNDVKTAFNEYKAAEQALADAIRDKEAKDALLDEATTAFNEAKAAFDEAEQAFNDASSTLTTLEGELSALNAEIEGIDGEIASLSATRSTAVDNLAAGGGQGRIDELSADGNSEGSVANLAITKESKEDAIKAIIAEADADKEVEDVTAEDIEAWLNAPENADNSAKTEYESAKSAYDNAVTELRTLEDYKSTIETSDTTLGQKAIDKSNKEAAASAKNTEVTDAKTAKDNAETAKDNAETTKNNASDAKSTAQTNADNAQTAVNEANATVATKKSAYESAVSSTTDGAVAAKQEEVANKESELATAESSMESLVGAADAAEGVYNDAVSALETAQETLDTATSELSTATEEVNTATEEFVSAGGEVSESNTPVDPDDTFAVG